jgi:hypothetical protein
VLPWLLVPALGILAVVVASLQVVPGATVTRNQFSWASAGAAALVSVVLTIRFLTQRPSSSRRVLVALALLIGGLVVAAVSFVASLIALLFGEVDPEHTMKIDQLDATVFVFEHACFPPDSATECDYENADVYLGRGNSPFMTEVTHVRWLVDRLERRGDTVLLHPDHAEGFDGVLELHVPTGRTRRRP